VLLSSDYATSVYGPALVEALTCAAPSARLLPVPRVECVVGDFHPIPFMVRASNRIGLTPCRMTDLWRHTVDIRALCVPFETPPVVETLWWHVAHTSDPAHRWLRDTAVAAGATIGDR
jgi:LysR family nod box-dependent transcriptional activator